MSQKHVVQQGEHGSAIAAKYGFYTVSTLWNAAENSALSARRETPDILLPGDEIQVPDKSVEPVQRRTTQVHRFVLLIDKLKVRLRVRDLAGKPIGSHPCELSIQGTPAASSTD